MTWINWVYSFIHIPGTIAFLVFLYYYTTVQGRQHEILPSTSTGPLNKSPTGQLLYEARRRALAVCNLLAFIIFTWWPCMPPRLLNDKNREDLGRNLGSGFDNFVDTVHGVAGVGSIWTQNRFCNQYGKPRISQANPPSGYSLTNCIAAMPSLHFGYSLMIGLTIMFIPLVPQKCRSASSRVSISNYSLPRICLLSHRRIACLLVGFTYPFLILVSIIATANHFILDAVAGAIVCGLAWQGNTILLNLLPLEDYFLWVVRIHKPE
jgi:PAP2 superfamily